MDIPDHLAIVVYDFAHQLKRPNSPETIGAMFQTAYWLAGQLEEVYADAGVDPAAVERPEIPPIGLWKPGEKEAYLAANPDVAAELSESWWDDAWDEEDAHRE